MTNRAFRRYGLSILVAAALVLLAFVVAAPGAVVQTFSADVKPRTESKPVSLEVEETTADDSAVQPPQLTRQVLRFNRGAQFNGRRFKKCKLSRLRAKGPSGCPRGSKIGTGTGTGSAKPILANVNAQLTLFNGERKRGHDTIYLYVFPDIGPTFVVVGTVKKTRGRYGHELDFRVPPIKTLPNAPDASVTSVHTRTPRKRTTVRKRGKKRRYYLIVAPRTCKRNWRAESVFYFANGEVQKVKDSVRCKKSRRGRR